MPKINKKQDIGIYIQVLILLELNLNLYFARLIFQYLGQEFKIKTAGSKPEG